MDDDWGLQAVVRGCTTTTTTSSCSVDDYGPLLSFQPREDESKFVVFSDPFETREEQSGSGGGSIEDLYDLFRPFFPKSQQPPPPPPPLSPLSPAQSIPISPLSVLGGLQDLSPPPPPQQSQKQHPKQFVYGSRSTTTTTIPSTSTATPHPPRTKRRKNVMKKVCHVPAEGLSSDMWSWRKYGQKPIKGSPYPRGYYRCSTSKGCMARKQVERNRSDPEMFIVTYTAEHNHPMPTHRNSLAGSTRQKPVTNQTATDAGDDDGKRACSSPVSSASLSSATEKVENAEEREDLAEDEEDELDVSDMVVDDDFFMGLDDIAGSATGDCFSGDSPMSFPFPWLASSSATTTAAGGG